MFQISDYIVGFSSSGAQISARQAAIATPSIIPLFRNNGTAWVEASNPNIFASPDANGLFSLFLPWPSQSDPSSVKWQIKMPDGAVFVGSVPEGVSGPVSLHDLKNTYNWGVVASTNTILAIQGPAGPMGPAGPPGSSLVDVKQFGAVGDGVHDDTVAIQAAIRSFPLLVGDVGSSAGVVWFPYGKYKITSSIIVDRAVVITGGGGSRFFPGTEIIAPAGVTAFQLFGQDNSPTGHGSARTVIQNIKIRASARNMTTTTGTRIANSQTVTVSSNQDFQVGQIIGIHGAGEQSKLIGLTGSTTAGLATVTVNLSINGFSFYSMASVGHYLAITGVTWGGGKPRTYVVGLSGSTITTADTADQTVTAAQVYSYEDLYARIQAINATTWSIDTVGGAFGTVTNVLIYHADCGIYSKVVYHGSNLTAEFFNGPGFFFYGEDVDPGLGGANTNGALLDFCSSYQNSHGVYFFGDSGNVSMILGCDVSENRSFGICDAGALGNTFVACQVSGSQGYRIVHDSVTRSTFLACYTEGGAYCSYATATFVLGGVMDPHQGGTSFTSQNDIGCIGSSGLRVGFTPLLLGDDLYTVDVVAKGALSALRIFSNNTTWPNAQPQELMKVVSGAAGWWGFNTNASSDGYPFLWSDNDVAVLGKGHFWAPRGVHIGTASDNTLDLNQSRMVAMGAAAPSTGTWVQGDRVFNRAPTETGTTGSKYVVTGWICTVGGTSGTWLEMRTLTGN